jgi:hypothetical protein
MTRDVRGTVLVAPHHFPNLDSEHALAEWISSLLSCREEEEDSVLLWLRETLM